MTPEEKSLLERTLKMAEENNSILRKMRRAHRFSTFLRVIYWILILAIGFGAYYFIQPYITSLTGMAGQGGGIQGIVGSIGKAQDAANSLKDIVK